MRKVNLLEINDNPTAEFRHKWALVTARKKDGTFNMCTISWGSIGELWSRPVVTVYIKPIRHTDSFLIEDDYFTVTFFNEDHKSDLAFCGTKSGRDHDKVKETNLTPIILENGVTFEGFRRVYVCKKIYAQQFEKDCFVDSQDIIDRYYVDEPCHNFYVGQIIDVLEQ